MIALICGLHVLLSSSLGLVRAAQPWELQRATRETARQGGFSERESDQPLALAAAGPAPIEFDLSKAALSPDQIGRHFFGLLGEHAGSGFLYDQGITFDGTDPIELANARREVQLSADQLYRLVTTLRSMATDAAITLPSPLNLREQAIQYYKMTGSVPVAIIDLEFESIEALSGRTTIDLRGRFRSVEPPRLRTHRLTAIAPLLQTVPATQFAVAAPPQFYYSNRHERSRFTLVAPGEMGTAQIAVPSHKHMTCNAAEVQALALTSRDGSRLASAWIEVVNARAPLSKARFALFRPIDESEQLLLLAAGAGDAAIPPTVRWTPGDPGSVVARMPPDETGLPSGELTGMQIAIWPSDHNDGLEQEGWDLEPLILLGGQDEDTNEPTVLYNVFAARLGPDAMAMIHSRFDVIAMSYWTGGSVDDELISRGIRRSVLVNSVLFADALHFLYGHYNIQKESAVVGISMGGVVSRLAFLGIENGPVSPAGIHVPHYRAIPNFPARTVPVRFWTTIDAPHQGAYVPLGLQDLASFFSFLPDVERQAKLLDAPSSKELLVEHHSAGQRVTTDERSTLVQQTAQWGGFPKTIGCSLAISSGSLAIPYRPYFWKLNGPRVPISPVDPTVWYVLNLLYGTALLPYQAQLRHTNDWKVSSQSVQMMYERPEVAASYRPLGPDGIPHFYALLDVLAIKQSGASLEATILAATTEPTYKKSSFREVEHPEYLSNFTPRRLALGYEGVSLIMWGAGIPWKSGWPPEPWQDEPTRSMLRASVKGSVRVEIALGFEKTVDFGGSYTISKPLKGGFKPIAFECGGFRPSARQLMSEVEEILGPAGTGSVPGIRTRAVYQPHHCFVPTISAIDLSPEFLANVYADFAQRSSGHYDEWRALARGSFNPEDFLDYQTLVGQYLDHIWGGVHDSRQLTIPQPGGASWTGRATPFHYYAVNRESLEHTFFEPEVVADFLRLLFSDDCDPRTLREKLGMVPVDRLRRWDAIYRPHESVLGRLPPLGGPGVLSRDQVEQELRRQLPWP